MSDAGESVPSYFDFTKPSHARVYDMFAGGKDHYTVDRAVYDQIVSIAPELPKVISAQRKWLIRVVEFLAGEAGISQFLDCGSGLPSADNTHQAAQRANPDAVVVYVDNDPIVIVHGQALLADNDRTFFLGHDITRPAELLQHPTVTENLDLTKPLALLHSGIVHLIDDADRPHEIVSTYVDALAPGSYLALSHMCRQSEESAYYDVARQLETTLKKLVVSSLTLRTREEITAFFDGLDLVHPGLTLLNNWRPRGPRGARVPDEAHLTLGGVARKPSIF